jgi:hypothetical protein
MATNGDIILYQTPEGETSIEVHLNNETVWLTQAQQAELFQKDVRTINEHIQNIYDEGELVRESTIRKFRIVRNEGTRQVARDVEHYNLDVIISVGYRVKSHRGVQFRVWATQTLREYIVKGFVIDDDRLSGKQANYFDELVERVRKIRTSEANFYAKVREIFATSIDYDRNSEYSKTFYATVQNKFHYAITGLTAAETIVKRVDGTKPKMGVVTTKGDEPTRQEAEIAKNYLEEIELKRLQLLVDQFLSFAELRSVEQQPMYMRDWIKRLDDFIVFNDKKVLRNAGSVSNERMKKVVSQEFEIHARQLLESGIGTEGFTTEGFTKDDMEKALRKVSRPSQPRRGKAKPTTSE